jgi:hypothetical protein
MQTLILAVVLSGAATDLPLPPKNDTTQIPCTVWANTKADTAGVIQVALGPGKDGTGPEGYDGYPVAVKLADNRARTCRFAGSLKLADRMLATYELRPESAVEHCLLLVELGKKSATIHDRKGTCGKVICGGDIRLDNLTFPADPKTKTCMAKRPEGQ